MEIAMSVKINSIRYVGPASDNSGLSDFQVEVRIFHSKTSSTVKRKIVSASNKKEAALAVARG
jgi:hypothetical protein